MHLSWLGLSAIKIETSDAVIVTDPFAPSVGARALRAKADIVTVSNPRSEFRNHTEAILGSPFVIDTPGEFEVKGVYIQGIRLEPQGSRVLAKRGTQDDGESAGTSATLFTFDLEDLRLAHLGDIRSVPPGSVLEKLGGVDILFLPVGGGSTLDPEAAMSVVNAIEPKLVIPVHFQSGGEKLPQRLLPVNAFLREMGASSVEPLERLSVKKRDLGEEETKVVVLRS